jgi:hypothetical protein
MDRVMPSPQDFHDRAVLSVAIDALADLGESRL